MPRNDFARITPIKRRKTRPGFKKRKWISSNMPMEMKKKLVKRSRKGKMLLRAW
jgi:hypothetical protein